jgi:cysteine desulfurase
MDMISHKAGHPAMIYMDYAASSPPYPEVAETVGELMLKFYGNPSSLHAAGAEAERLIRTAADVMAERLGADRKEIIFTSGGTESNNLAIFGTALAHAGRGRHLVVSSIEHPSVYECFRALEKRGFRVTWLDADETGAVRPEDVEAALTDDTILVSLMAVNNETGRIQPIERVGELLRERRKIVFHVDAVQAAGKLPLNPARLGIDLMSLSAHKFHGPKGAGVLYKRSGLAIEPILRGGGQQGGYRSGTENTPAIVGMAKAFRIATDRMRDEMPRLAAMRRSLLETLAKDARIRVTDTPDGSGMAPHIAHFRIPGVKAEAMVHFLEREGFCVSSQSACSSGEEKPSRVLLAMGLSEREAMSGIRVSIGPENTPEQMAGLAEAVVRILDQYGNVMG